MRPAGSAAGAGCAPPELPASEPLRPQTPTPKQTEDAIALPPEPEPEPEPALFIGLAVGVEAEPRGDGREGGTADAGRGAVVGPPLGMFGVCGGAAAFGVDGEGPAEREPADRPLACSIAARDSSRFFRLRSSSESM